MHVNIIPAVLHLASAIIFVNATKKESLRVYA